MKLKNKLVILLGAVVVGATAHKYVTDHRAELDRFLAEYGEIMENEYVEEDLIEPEIN